MATIVPGCVNLSSRDIVGGYIDMRKTFARLSARATSKQFFQQWEGEYNTIAQLNSIPECEYLGVVAGRIRFYGSFEAARIVNQESGAAVHAVGISYGEVIWEMGSRNGMIVM